MKMLFIDECQVSDFFCVGALFIDSSQYKGIKKWFDGAFQALNWDQKVEFKGRYVFSRSGDKNVNIESRIEFVRSIASSSKAEKNGKLWFFFCLGRASKKAETWYHFYSSLLRKLPKPSDRRRDKDVLAVFYDQDLALDNETVFSLTQKGASSYSLFERPFFVDSDNKTSGILLADTFTYLATMRAFLDQKGTAVLESELNEVDEKKKVAIRELLAGIKNLKQVEPQSRK